MSDVSRAQRMAMRYYPEAADKVIRDEERAKVVPEGCVVVTPDEQEAIREMVQHFETDTLKHGDEAMSDLWAALPLWAVTE